MKYSKLIKPMMAGLVTVSLFGCEATSSKYEAMYSYELEVETFLDYLEMSGELFNTYGGAETLGVDKLSIPKASKFKENQDGIYLYEKRDTSITLFTKKDEVSRIEFTLNLTPDLSMDEVVNLSGNYSLACLILNPELIVDEESYEEFQNFINETMDTILENDSKKHSNVLEWYDTDYSIDYNPSKTLTLALAANGEDDFESSDLEDTLALLELLLESSSSTTNPMINMTEDVSLTNSNSLNNEDLSNQTAGLTEVYDNVYLKIPSNWTEYNLAGQTVYYLDSNNTNFNLIVESMYGYSEDDYLNASLKTVQNDFQVAESNIEVKKGNLNGYSAYSFTYETDFAGQTLKLYQVTVFNNGNAHIFTLGGFPSYVDAQIPTLQSVLNTIEFR